MNLKKYMIYLLPLAFVACEPEFDDVKFEAGAADFSRTVAVGNSLTAGFQSNALSAEGQINSLPNIVAEQLKIVGGGEFKQAIIPGEAGEKGAGLANELSPLGFLAPELKLALVEDCKMETSLAPTFLPSGFDTIPLPFPPPQDKAAVPKSRYSAAQFLSNVSNDGPYHNLGIPGAKITDINNTSYGNAYYSRMAISGESMVQAAVKTNPTFFMLWIGNNDVLGYATSGGAGSVTASGDFNSALTQTLDALTANNAKGVIANIPDITSIPFFTTVKWNALELTAEQATALNGAYTTYNNAVEGNRAVIGDAEADRRKINFSAGTNAFVVLDGSLQDLEDGSGNIIPDFKLRQMTNRELLTLTTPSDDIKCMGFGSFNQSTSKYNPITENYLIDENELSIINSAISSYNTTIQNEATVRGLALVDAYALLKELSTTGININGISFTSDFITGGAFSLDGVHPSTRGYAIIANDFIKAINSTFGANVPQVDVADYPTYEVTQ